MLGFGSRAANAIAAKKRFEGDIEMLRLRITATEGAGRRVISLLGQAPGAGTTTLALGLARSLARESRRTLLIDGNFANPALHGLLQADPEPGVAEWLEGRATLDTVIRPTSEQNLSWMPCGRGEAAAIGAAVGEWRGRWRDLASDWFLVIDAGSADVPSGLAMADASDGVIVVIKCGEARREQLESLQRRMSLSGARLLGVVLNQRRHVVPDVIYRRL